MPRFSQGFAALIRRPNYDLKIFGFQFHGYPIASDRPFDFICRAFWWHQNGSINSEVRIDWGLWLTLCTSNGMKSPLSCCLPNDTVCRNGSLEVRFSLSFLILRWCDMSNINEKEVWSFRRVNRVPTRYCLHYLIANTMTSLLLAAEWCRFWLEIHGEECYEHPFWVRASAMATSFSLTRRRVLSTVSTMGSSTPPFNCSKGLWTLV